MALALDGSIQSTNFFGTTQAAPLTTTGGSGRIVVALEFGTSVTPTVTATGLSFTQLGSTVTPSASAGALMVFTAPYTSNFSGNITVDTGATSTLINIIAFGISGAETWSSFYDTNASLPATPTSGDPTGTTSNANDFVFSAEVTTSSDSTAGAGWTALFTSSMTNFTLLYQIASATGSFTPTLAAGGPATGSFLHAIMQASGGGGGTDTLFGSAPIIFM